MKYARNLKKKTSGRLEYYKEYKEKKEAKVAIQEPKEKSREQFRPKMMENYREPKVILSYIKTAQMKIGI